jgi:hypothetical protein
VQTHEAEHGLEGRAAVPRGMSAAITVP